MGNFCPTRDYEHLDELKNPQKGEFLKSLLQASCKDDVDAAFLAASVESINEVIKIHKPIHGYCWNSKHSIELFSHTIDSFLAIGVSIHERDGYGRVPLMCVTSKVPSDMIKRVQCLVSKGANVNSIDNNKINVVETLCEFDDPDVISFLIQEKNAEPRNVAYQCGVYGSLKVAKWLVDNGFDINKCDKKEWSSALCGAFIRENGPEIIKGLIELGANPNVSFPKYRDGSVKISTLHMAFDYYREAEPIIRALLDGGALPDGPEDCYCTPHNYTKWRNIKSRDVEKCRALLLERGANPNL